MSSILFTSTLLMTCGLAPQLSAQTLSPALQKVIADSAKDPNLSLMWSQATMGGTKGAADFEAGMNKMFGTKIKIKFTPGPSMPAVGNEIAMRATAGQPAQTDVFIAFSRDMAELIEKKLFMPVNWTELAPGRIPKEAVEADGTALKILTGLLGVTYNTQLAPSKPESLADFLKPEWKGKIATTPYSAGFDILAGKDVFGSQKALDYAKQLTPQIAGLTRCDENERLASGEFLAMVIDCGDLGQQALISKGAPIAHFTPKDYPVMSFYYLTVPKNASNPNAAILFTVFASMPEGQKIIRDYWGGDMHLYPEAQTHKTAMEVEAKIGQKLHSIDLSWQNDNAEGRKTHAEINKILAVKK
jgi:ABC-type Fe3+ transport system substrate-binding protein